MSEITEGNRIDLLNEFRKLVPDIDYASRESYGGADIVFEDSCGCYSEYTTECCRIQVFVTGTRPVDYDDHHLCQELEQILHEFAAANLEWDGCFCCNNDLWADVRFFPRKS